MQNSRYFRIRASPIDNLETEIVIDKKFSDLQSFFLQSILAKPYQIKCIGKFSFHKNSDFAEKHNAQTLQFITSTPEKIQSKVTQNKDTHSVLYCCYFLLVLKFLGLHFNFCFLRVNFESTRHSTRLGQSSRTWQCIKHLLVLTCTAVGNFLLCATW